MIVEAPLLDEDGRIANFTATWKTERSFPIDMAAFSINISLLHDFPSAAFSYNVQRGYQVCKIFLCIFNLAFCILYFYRSRIFSLLSTSRETI